MSYSIETYITNFKEKLGDTSDILVKPYVSSTKAMVNELIMQRKALSLSEYKATSERNRLVNDHEWQSSKEFEAFYKKAQHKISTFDGQVPNFETFIDEHQKFSDIKKPFEALPELWPRLPQTVITNSSGEHKNEEQPDTLTTVCETLDFENGQEGLKENNNKIEPHPNIPESVETLKQTTNFLHDQIDPLKTIKFSMDSILTQNMARKRKLRTFGSAERISPVSRKRKKTMTPDLYYGENYFVYRVPPFGYRGYS